MLNSAPKYVASRTLSEPLQPGKDLNVMGSGEPDSDADAARPHRRISAPIHPLVLGAGRRLFGDGGPPASLSLADSTVSTTGALIASYQPEQPD
jgi:hypothetical protein